MFNSSVTLCILNSAMILSFNVSQTSSRCSSWQLENGLKTCESQRLPEDVVQSAGVASWVLKLPLVQTNQNLWQQTKIGRSDNCAAAILGASQQRRARQLVGRRRQWDTCRRSRWRLPLPVIPHWDAGCRLLINRLTSPTLCRMAGSWSMGHLVSRHRPSDDSVEGQRGRGGEHRDGRDRVECFVPGPCPIHQAPIRQTRPLLVSALRGSVPCLHTSHLLPIYPGGYLGRSQTQFLTNSWQCVCPNITNIESLQNPPNFAQATTSWIAAFCCILKF